MPVAGRVIAPPAVVVDGLIRRYGERAVLEHVSFVVPHGATVALIGANGAGKTTLLRVLSGLLRPHGGSVRVCGHDVAADADRVRSKVGYLAAATEPLLVSDPAADGLLGWVAVLGCYGAIFGLTAVAVFEALVED